jgi:RNA polymerase sigma-70 factor (ECF subfamily)
MEINIEDYYKKYGPMVLKRCRFLLKDEEKALDAMQDVFVKLLLFQNKIKKKYPSSLLLRIATNICLNVIRSNKRKGETRSEKILSNIASWDEPEEKIILSDLLDRIFKNEHKSTKVIAVMHYVDGLTLKETAKAVGLSVSGVRKRLKKLKENIKTNFDIRI